MGRFENYEDIYGEADAEALAETTQEFLALVKEIKRKLGKKSYKLEKYLDLLLTGAAENKCAKAVGLGGNMCMEQTALE
jgi:hypothetical protein